MRNCRICLEPQHCDCLCETCTAAKSRYADPNDREQGWQMAKDLHETGLVDITTHYSQGETEWDRGWNLYIDSLLAETDTHRRG